MSREETFECFRDEWLMATDDVLKAHGGWPPVGSVKEHQEMES